MRIEERKIVPQGVFTYSLPPPNLLSFSHSFSLFPVISYHCVIIFAPSPLLPPQTHSRNINRHTTSTLKQVTYMYEKLTTHLYKMTSNVNTPNAQVHVSLELGFSQLPYRVHRGCDLKVVVIEKFRQIQDEVGEKIFSKTS